MKVISVIFLCAIMIISMTSISMAKGNDTAIKNGSKVSFDYTLTVDGKVMDSSQGRAPLQYVQGQGTIIPGLAKQLEGMKIGDEKSITVPPEEAYGAVDQNAFREVPRSSMPAGLKPEVGMYLQTKNPDGTPRPVKIAGVKKDVVMIDFNHPLAGKTLHFNVKIISVQ